jgi:hypothetical protein
MRLADVGTPSDPEAVAVYEQLRTLLLTPRFRRRNGRSTLQITHLREALDALPPDAAVLRQVAETMRLWQKITGRSVKQDRFQADRVIKTMLEVPEPEAYIRHLDAQGLPHFAAMFHPNTLERARKAPALRGVFDARNTEYWQQLRGQLNVVED